MFWNFITCLNLDLSTSNAFSMIFLVWQWARLYLSSIWVDGVLNDVMRKSFKRYPESPSSQPPFDRLAMIPGMFEFDITHVSCVLPGNRKLMLRNLKHEYSIVWSYKIEKCIVLYFKMNYVCNGLHCTNSLTVSEQTSSLRPQPLVHSGHESFSLIHEYAPHRHSFLW